MGTIDELEPRAGDKTGRTSPTDFNTHDADFYYRHKALVYDPNYGPQQQRKIDSTLDLTKDIGNYKPRALSGSERRCDVNTLSRSERDLRCMQFVDVGHAHAQPETVGDASHFSPIQQDHVCISPQELSPLMLSPSMASSQQQLQPLRSQSMTSFGRDRNNPTPHPFTQHRLSLSITNPELSSEPYARETSRDQYPPSSPRDQYPSSPRDQHPSSPRDQYHSPHENQYQHRNQYQSPVSPALYHEYQTPNTSVSRDDRHRSQAAAMSPPAYSPPSSNQSLAYQYNARLTQSQTNFASPVYSSHSTSRGGSSRSEHSRSQSNLHAYPPPYRSPLSPTTSAQHQHRELQPATSDSLTSPPPSSAHNPPMLPPLRSPRTPRPHSIDVSRLSDTLNTMQLRHCDVTQWQAGVTSLDELMRGVKLALSELQAQNYAELQRLDEQIHYLDRLLKVRSLPRPSAQGAFGVCNFHRLMKCA